MQITLFVITEALCSSETVVPKYNTIYTSEEKDMNTNHHENLKRKMAINDIKFQSLVGIHNTLYSYNRRRRIIHLQRWQNIHVEQKSLDNRGNSFDSDFWATLSVIKLKWKFEVLSVITVKIPALWNVKSCSLWTCTSDKSLQFTCQNKRYHIKRREQSSRRKLSGEHN
jgi:hypothetical protein